MSTGWQIVERSARPEELVGELPASEGRRLVCICHPTAPALVLGSAQSPGVVDEERLAAMGASIVRRRSGGGAVYVAPGAQVWLDAFLPAGDPLLVADVGRSAWWLGERWVEALATASEDTTVAYAVHRGGLVPSRWSRTVCFAGIGPGEVTSQGRKLVGISQRRDRAGAWLHSMALARLDPSELAGLFARPPSEQADIARELAGGVGVVSALPGRLVHELRACFS